VAGRPVIGRSTVAGWSRAGGLDIFNGVGGARRRRRHGGLFLRGLATLVAVGLVAVAGWFLYRLINPDNTVQLQVLGVDGPVEGAVIQAPSGSATTASEGLAPLSLEPPVSLTVTAPGYQTGVFQVDGVPPEGPLGLQLDPVVLNGRVTDPRGTGVAGATVRAGGREANTSDMGSFELTAVVPGPVEVSKIAWETATAEWDGSEGRFEITMSPFLVRGLRVNSEVAGAPADFDAILQMIEGTTINTLAFDTKQESGMVMYDSQVPDARSTGAVVAFYDLSSVLAKAKAQGLYTITRIVTFQDEYWASANPDHAITDSSTGEPWRNQRGLAWMDPTDRQAWEYPLALAAEACDLGFDEIQFDYVRFPTDGDISTASYDQEVDASLRVETIAAFLKEAQTRLHAKGCAVSADIFAIVLSVPDDQGLGQRVEELSHSVDALSPMIYPSHYSPGWLGFADPNAHPADVVGEALASGLPKLEGGAVLRPWLQSFYYDAAQIGAEIDQAESNGLGWLLWNAASEFVPEWLPKG
jgi:hypothetical protein